MEAFERGVEPFKAFMLQHTRPKDLELFTEISETEPVTEAMDLPIHVVSRPL